MDVSSIPKQVLKDLSLQYQENQDGKIFERILVRVDRLVQYVMLRQALRWRYLYYCDMQDLYQTSILGLLNGILTVRESDTPEQVIYRYAAYIKNEIEKQFTLRKHDRLVTTTPGHEDEPVYHDLECAFLQEAFEGLVKRGIITERELRIIKLRYSEQLQWKVIAQHEKMGVERVKVMAYKALLRMRHQLRSQGIDCNEDRHAYV